MCLPTWEKLTDISENGGEDRQLVRKRESNWKDNERRE